MYHFELTGDLGHSGASLLTSACMSFNSHSSSSPTLPSEGGPSPRFQYRFESWSCIFLRKALFCHARVRRLIFSRVRRLLHLSFFILHSSFFILHSSFFILDSSFFILHYSSPSVLLLSRPRAVLAKRIISVIIFTRCCPVVLYERSAAWHSSCMARAPHVFFGRVLVYEDCVSTAQCPMRSLLAQCLSVSLPVRLHCQLAKKLWHRCVPYHFPC